RSSYFCAFPRFPVRPSVDSPLAELLPHYSSDVPAPLRLHRRQSSVSSRPRILPVAVSTALDTLDSPTLGHRRQYTPPKATTSSTSVSPPTSRSPPSRTVFSSASKARPLRLVKDNNPKKRRPPVFYAQNSHSLVQSRTFITIRQHDADNNNNTHSRNTSSSSFLSEDANMSSPPPNPVSMPKTGGPSTMPGTVVRPEGGGNKDRLLADLRRQQLDDSASDVSSVDSRGNRRRRRRNRNNQLASQGGGLTGPAIMPRLAETKPVRLQLGLNLDVEVELKARLQGDVSLTLLVEKNPSARPCSSTELRLPLPGAACSIPLSSSSFFSNTTNPLATSSPYSSPSSSTGNDNRNIPGNSDDTDAAAAYAELFYMRIGRFSLRQRWIDRETSASLTGVVVMVVALVG
ncbi:hypothetical protein C8A05DRAFT_36072, partial [Staphylotrichum tortipilum]